MGQGEGGSDGGEEAGEEGGEAGHVTPKNKNVSEGVISW